MGGAPLERLLRCAQLVGSAVSLTLLAILVSVITHQSPAEAVGSPLPTSAAPGSSAPAVKAPVSSSPPAVPAAKAAVPAKPVAAPPAPPAKPVAAAAPVKAAI